jgi:hypothetical protein
MSHNNTKAPKGPRGRPPLVNPLSGAERARRHRAKLQAKHAAPQSGREENPCQQIIKSDVTNIRDIAERLAQVAGERDYLRFEVERLHNENDKLFAELKYEAQLHTITIKSHIVAKDRIALRENKLPKKA